MQQSHSTQGRPSALALVSRRRLTGAALAFAMLNACAAPRQRVLALPVLDGQPLRVVYAHNPRFERLPAALMAVILGRAQALCKLHLRLELQFAAPTEQPIATLFRGVTPAVWNPLKEATYDVKNNTGDRALLVKTTRQSLARNQSAIPAQIAFAQPYLLSKILPTNVASLSEALVDTQLERMRLWMALKGLDGRALLDESVFNEYLAWIYAPRTAPWPYEIVITNQLIASVEYVENSIHTALRGGVSNGLTMQSPSSRYGTVSVLSMFPFTSQDAVTRLLRGDVQGQSTDVVEAAASLLAHELGHQLLHLGHPFGSAACVMNPPQLLQFSAWTRGLNAMQCPVGNSAENKPGVVRFSAVDQ